MHRAPSRRGPSGRRRAGLLALCARRSRARHGFLGDELCATTCRAPSSVGASGLHGLWLVA
eukprot:1956588-Alexandrium_andersonii.AAC.1